MLRLDDVTVRFRAGRGWFDAVRGVDLEVPPGGTLGLVGESGSGKSTVAKAAAGFVPVTAGRVFLGDMELSAQRGRALRSARRRLQVVFQDPYASLNPRRSVGEIITQAASTTGRTRVESERRTHELLDRTGLGARAFHRYPHEFSGGQRQRIAIARALAADPEVIIADEPTSALDVSVQAAVLELLRELQEETGVSMLFISHNLAVVRAVAQRVAVMYLGRIVEIGPSDQVFSSPEHPYTRTLLDAVPEIGGRPGRTRLALGDDIPDPRFRPSGCSFHTRCPVGVRCDPERTVCSDEEPTLTLGDHMVACHFPLSVTSRSAVNGIE